ncbi:MAG: hypothetical protein RLZZ342_269 [Candidatus Parcubacteria bacterium]|jgi:hypothetical protein
MALISFLIGILFIVDGIALAISSSYRSYWHRHWNRNMSLLDQYLASGPSRKFAIYFDIALKSLSIGLLFLFIGFLLLS